jgi:hypothetical protein
MGSTHASPNMSEYPLKKINAFLLATDEAEKDCQQKLAF